MEDLVSGRRGKTVKNMHRNSSVILTGSTIKEAVRLQIEALRKQFNNEYAVRVLAKITADAEKALAEVRSNTK